MMPETAALSEAMTSNQRRYYNRLKSVEGEGIFWVTLGVYIVQIRAHVDVGD